MVKDLTVGKTRRSDMEIFYSDVCAVSFSQQMYNIADSVIAGKLAGEDALAVGRLHTDHHDFLGHCGRQQHRMFRCDSYSCLVQKEYEKK